jgi:hypothetical protein
LWITSILLINKPINISTMSFDYCVNCDRPSEVCVCGKLRFGMSKKELEEYKQRQKRAKRFDPKSSH